MTQRTCTIDGCTRELRARGMCPTHWLRWKKHGDPNVGAAKRNPPVCFVDECDRKAVRRSMCDLHHSRWQRHGDPLAFRPDAIRGCAIGDCDGAHYGRGLCRLHWARWSKTGDPLGLRSHFSPLSGLAGDLNPQWVGDAAGYEAVHARLRKDCGVAADYACRHCGAVAADWAYDNEDPDERLSHGGLWFSVKGQDHYLPLCRSCHRTFDVEWRVRRDSGAEAVHPSAS